MQWYRSDLRSRNQYNITEIVRNKQSYNVVDEFGREETDSHVANRESTVY